MFVSIQNWPLVIIIYRKRTLEFVWKEQNRYRHFCTYHRISSWDYLVGLARSLWVGFCCWWCICFTHRLGLHRITFEQSEKKKRSNVENAEQLIKQLICWFITEMFIIPPPLTKNQSIQWQREKLEWGLRKKSYTIILHYKKTEKIVEKIALWIERATVWWL